MKRGEGVVKIPINKNPIVTLYTIFHRVLNIFHDLARNMVDCQNDNVTKMIENEAVF